jgi:citrate synthase
MVDQRRIDDQRWVDSRTAAKRLGVQQRTLYAYVSRGQVRSVPGSQGRPRLYALEDIERLEVRRDARAGHSAVAAGALRWGEPVLDSAITAITARGPAYRGRLATELAAAGLAFENVAELLWSG